MTNTAVQKKVTLALGPSSDVSKVAPYRFKLGDFDFTILSDGYFSLPGTVFAPEASLTERADVVARLGFANDTIRSRANIPVIKIGDEVILVDVGAGQKYEPTEGCWPAISPRRVLIPLR
jgi:hypothetical protein